MLSYLKYTFLQILQKKDFILKSLFEIQLKGLISYKKWLYFCKHFEDIGRSGNQNLTNFLEMW